MKYFKNILIILTTLVINTIIFGSLSYINIINEKVLFFIQYIMLFITLFIEGYYLGKNKDKNGYIEGLINGSIISISFIIINLLTKRDFNIYKLLFYLLIIVVSMLSSILGINKKMKD